MSELGNKNEERKVETDSDKAKNIHKTFSILYIGVIALCTPVVLIGQAFDAKELANSFMIDSLWVIISIATSRFFINKGKISLAYWILFSAPFVVFVYETILWNIRQASF